jgi:hypothetical protein
MSKTGVLTAGDVTGNISNCEFIKELTVVDRASAFSIVQEETYVVMNNCTGEIVSEYTNMALTGISLVWLVPLVIILTVVLIAKATDIICY